MEFDYEKAVETAQEFKKLLNNAKQIMSMCEAEIVEADKAFGDIRHYCELHYSSDRKKQREVCKLIHKYSNQRRFAKDVQAIMQPLADFVESAGQAKGNLEFCINNMKKELNRINGERVYVPRVLNELFKEDEDNGKIGS